MYDGNPTTPRPSLYDGILSFLVSATMRVMVIVFCINYFPEVVLAIQPGLGRLIYSSPRFLAAEFYLGPRIASRRPAPGIKVGLRFLAPQDLQITYLIILLSP
jgi:hypothetical protein